MYICNPDKALTCKKTECFINGGECRRTSNPEWAFSENVVNTHHCAAGILQIFEEMLCRYNIKVPSPEDDERGDDNEAALYGSVYSDLLDKIEEELIFAIDQVKNGAEVISYIFGFDIFEGGQ